VLRHRRQNAESQRQADGTKAKPSVGSDVVRNSHTNAAIRDRAPTQGAPTQILNLRFERDRLSLIQLGRPNNQQSRLLGVPDCAHQRSAKLIGKAPGCMQVTFFAGSRFLLTNVSVRTGATEQASFHSRPFGLANNPLWRRSSDKASIKVYLSVKFVSGMPG
jgi:hypothetical protein